MHFSLEKKMKKKSLNLLISLQQSLCLVRYVPFLKRDNRMNCYVNKVVDKIDNLKKQNRKLRW